MWNVVQYGVDPSADPSEDQQTGIRDADIVGDANNPSFYTAFDDADTPLVLTDGTLGFRLRVAGDKNPSGFESAFWVGIDANLDGAIDLFAAAIEGSEVGLYPAGSGANISPSTTSIDSSNPYYEVSATSANYDFQSVNTTIDPTLTNDNLDGGSGGGGDHTDYFVSFSLPLIELATAVDSLNLPGIGSFDETNALQYVTATSNNANSLNQDLNGINGGQSSSTSWEDLGGFSEILSANGLPVPEPSSWVFSSLAGLIMLRHRRR
ncbi:hypothetical protein JO972_11550 [Verrucomicrobiaceae bacterium 5K15]|uniref:PEP-CTERM protein-sorting domain-containing protein n=1 Tax=Oceaniferula flava TaxID=2800421 RepID=A0AAE2V8I2_9BACT|nr:hypothetical protein [Oceaniferula flavus]MBK1855597.1 hypothetical protein [Oceaniferula flavus]MBM1136903.1 hypothetical protein [Oceaniferula flavus]